MADEKLARVYKVTVMLEEGTMSKDDGYMPLLPNNHLTVQYMMDKEAAADKVFRDTISCKAMAAFWEKLK